MFGFLEWVRSHTVCVWGCSCIQSLEAAASEAHADHRSAHVQTVSHLPVGFVPLLTGCQRHSNPVACSAAETTPGGRGRQQYSSLTRLWVVCYKNSSGDEIANVNFLRRYGTYVLQNTNTNCAVWKGGWSLWTQISPGKGRPHQWIFASEN